MLQLYTEALAAYNLPATLLLGLVTLYWMTVILGISSGDSNVEATLSKAEGVSGTLSSLSGGGSISKRLGIWPVPLSVFGSGFALVWWLICVLLHHYTDRANWPATWWHSPAVWIFSASLSYGLCVILFRALRGLFKGFANYHGENQTLVGLTGVVSTTDVTHDHGQVHLPSEGAPILFNVRTLPNAMPLHKGQSVILVSQHASGNFYYIESHPSSLT